MVIEAEVSEIVELVVGRIPVEVSDLAALALTIPVEPKANAATAPACEKHLGLSCLGSALPRHVLAPNDA
jgi:hypothetical protein